MGVIEGRSRAAVTAPNADGTAPETLQELLIDGGVTTDDGLSEIEPEEAITNDGIQSGRIRILPSRRSQLRPRSYRNRHPAIPVNTAPPPKVSQHGSKKFRRYENQLELLKECDENEPQEVSIEDFINGANSARAFSKILQESHMLDLWNKFMDEPENLLEANEAKKNRSQGARGCRSSCEFDPDEAFQGICRKLRGFIKQRHFPLGMMENFEEDLIEFFSTRPEETFESDPLDAFRRGMIHAVSQYNSLRSHSVKCKDNPKDNTKKVRVLPSEQPFSPPPVRLVHYLETKYHSPKTNVV